MSNESNPADLLAAASLLLAALAVLYSVWYSSIEDARTLKLPTKRDDAVKPVTQIQGVLHGRAYPLAIASCLATIIFVPEAITILVSTVNSFADHGLGAFGYYNPIEAALFVVTLGLAFLTIDSARLSMSLRKKVSKGKALPA